MESVPIALLAFKVKGLRFSGVARISGQGGPKKIRGDHLKLFSKKIFPERIFSDDLPPPVAKKISVSVPF